MIYVSGLKSILSELVSPHISMQYKKMRLSARFPAKRGSARGEYLEPASYGNPIVSKGVNSTASITSIVKEIESKGFSRSVYLEMETLKKIVEYCNQSYFLPNRNPKESKVKICYQDAEPPGNASIFSIIDPHKDNDLISNIVSSPTLLGIAGNYLNAKPILLNSQIWYTFPARENFIRDHDYQFHYDIDDYRFLKFFFYLDEVGKDHGPHVIISGTHSEDTWFKIINRRISDSAAKKKYGEKITVMEGGAGQGFAEDTFCYHKGTYPVKRRLIFQVQFGISR